GSLGVLLVVTPLTALFGTAACSGITSNRLWYLEARAAGLRPMSCGPPVELCAVPVLYGMALLGACLAPAFGRRPGAARPNLDPLDLLLERWGQRKAFEFDPQRRQLVFTRGAVQVRAGEAHDGRIRVAYESA